MLLTVTFEKASPATGSTSVNREIDPVRGLSPLAFVAAA
jgi:hypothetical protein